MQDPRGVLGVSPSASPKEIRKAYHRLVKRWHPDRFLSDEKRRLEAEQMTRLLNDAYRLLMQPASQPPSPTAASDLRSRLKAAADRTGPGRAFWFAVAGAVFSVAVVFLILRGSERAANVRVNGVAFSEWEWRSSFRPGSTKDEVLAVQGEPERTQGDLWYYGRDWVSFREGRVSSYSNAQGKLRVRLPFRVGVDTAPQRAVWLGSPERDVYATHGAPTRYLEDTWYYDTDWVGFEEGKLSKFSNIGGRLRLRPETVAKPKETRFGVGTESLDLVAIQGVPLRVEGDVWYYGTDFVMMENGVVRSYSNASRKLKTVSTNAL